MRPKTQNFWTNILIYIIEVVSINKYEQVRATSGFTDLCFLHNNPSSNFFQLLPTSSKIKSLTSFNDTHAKESEDNKVSRIALLSKAIAFSQKIVHGVSENYQTALEELQNYKNDLSNLYSVIESCSNAKTKKILSNYSNYLLKILNEDLSGEVAESDEAKSIKAINLNKNVLSLAVHGEEIERNLVRGWDLRRSIGKEALRKLSKEVDDFTWSFAKKIGLDWGITIEEAEKQKDVMTSLKDKISAIAQDETYKDNEYAKNLKFYLFYLEKILKEDLLGDKSNNAAEITRAIQKNLLSMIDYLKKFKGSIKDTHKTLFKDATNFSHESGISVAANNLMALEAMESKKESFQDLNGRIETTNGELKNKKMKGNLTYYSHYLKKIFNEDLTREETDDELTKSIKAISLNKNIVSLLVHGEKIEKTANWREDWRESIGNEELRDLSREIDRFTWSFAKKIGSNWMKTMEEVKNHESRMKELEKKIISIAKDVAHKDKDYTEKLQHYSVYLKKILEEDLPVYKENNTNVAVAVTKAAQKNLLYMINHWKEFKEALKK